MIKNYLFLCVIVYSFFASECKSGLVTTTNACYNAIQRGQAANKSADYSTALDQFNQILQQCKAYDAKEKAYAGKAEALNGLKQYTDAIDAANNGLKINKSSVDNLFQRASAEFSLNRSADAKADFSSLIDFTQQNKNVADRATIYAKMAQIDLTQKMYSDAMNNINTAISLDNKNASLHVLMGDLYTAQNDFSQAMTSYDAAISLDGNNTNAISGRTEAEVKLYQQKYNTTDVAQLASKMTSQEKHDLCKTISQAKDSGIKMMNFDLIQISICK